MKLLSRIDELILVSIWKLGRGAYGMAIREEIIRATGANWLLGAIYGPLGRLHRQGLVTTIKGEPTPERGGRAKVYYELTPVGLKELQKIHAVSSAIWKGAQKIHV
jgi:PadR family transcriptional regulator, regulatory protein PadR